MNLRSRLVKLEMQKRAAASERDDEARREDARYAANLRARLVDIKISIKRSERARNPLDTRTDEAIATEVEAEIQASEKSILKRIAQSPDPSEPI